MEHRMASSLFRGNIEILDPGNAGTITSDRDPCFVNVASAGAETRTLARPTRVGDFITLGMSVAGGTVTVTVTGGYNLNGDTTFTLTAVGQFYLFESVYDGTNYRWMRIASYSDSNLSATELGYLDGVTAGTSAASKAVVTDSSGNEAFTGRLTTTDGVASGTAKVVGGLAYSNTAASTAIASTSAETLFDTSYNMPANTLKAGTMVRVRFQGIQTTEIGTDTMAFKLYIGGTGGTAVITSAAATGANAATIQGECTLICRTAGTTGTFVATGTYKQVSAEGTMTVKDDITASTTINTQASQLIAATATFNTTNANSVRMDVFTVEIY